MPIYMDRHDVLGVNAEDVARAHQEDLKIQEKYGCRVVTYWFDGERGTAFCLIEAPNIDAVKEMHDKAHGLIPHLIIEVDSVIVENFLGRIENPISTNSLGDSNFYVIKDPAFRTILVTNLKDAALMSSKFKKKEILELIGSHDNIIQQALNLHEGREVQHGEDCFIASFAEVSQAVNCAVKIQNDFKEANCTISGFNLQVQIGVSAGVPVTENHVFFGQSVQLAKQLCFVAGPTQIVVSPIVYELCKKEGLNMSGNGNDIKTLNPSEEKHLCQIMAITEKCWNDSLFNIHELAKQMGVSKSQLYRKTVSLTGYSPNDFIKEFRLQKALNAIEKQQENISEIAYKSGFNSLSYFSKCFQKRFNLLPSQQATAIANRLSS